MPRGMLWWGWGLGLRLPTTARTSCTCSLVATPQYVCGSVPSDTNNTLLLPTTLYRTIHCVCMFPCNVWCIYKASLSLSVSFNRGIVQTHPCVHTLQWIYGPSAENERSLCTLSPDRGLMEWSKSTYNTYALLY